MIPMMHDRFDLAWLGPSLRGGLEQISALLTVNYVAAGDLTIDGSRAALSAASDDRTIESAN